MVRSEVDSRVYACKKSKRNYVSGIFSPSMEAEIAVEACKKVADLLLLFADGGERDRRLDAVEDLVCVLVFLV